MADNFNPYYNDNRASTLARKDLRFQEELMRHQKANNLGSQVAAKGRDYTRDTSLHSGKVGIKGPSTPKGKSKSSMPSSGKMEAGLKLASSLQGGAGEEGGTTSTSEGAVSGGISGAAQGASMGGIPGAIIGGGLGAITGGMKAKAAAKKARADITAERHEAQGKIEEDKVVRLNHALSGLMSQFGNTLN